MFWNPLRDRETLVICPIYFLWLCLRISVQRLTPGLVELPVIVIDDILIFPLAGVKSHACLQCSVIAAPLVQNATCASRINRITVATFSPPSLPPPPWPLTVHRSLFTIHHSSWTTSRYALWIELWAPVLHQSLQQHWAVSPEPSHHTCPCGFIRYKQLTLSGILRSSIAQSFQIPCKSFSSIVSLW